MKNRIEYKEIIYHKIPKAILLINEELSNNEGRIAYEGEHHIFEYKGKQVLYSIEQLYDKKGKPYKENIFVHGVLDREKHLGEEILNGKILPLGFKANLVALVKGIVGVNIEELSTGDAIINLEGGRKISVSYDNFEGDIYTYIKNTKREV